MRDRLFTWAFWLYAVFILGSQATMSISAVALIAAMALLWPGGWSGLRSDHARLWANVETRAYFRVSLALTAALAVTLTVQGLSPIVIGEPQDLEFARMMLKSWYLFWPIPLAAGFVRLGERDRRKTLFIWIGTLAVMSVVGVIQHYTGWPRPQVIPEFPERFHATAFLGHHLSAASIFIFPLFVALDLAFDGGLRRRTRVLFGATVLLGSACLLLGFSRMLWVALPLGFLAWLVLSLSPRARVGATIGFILLGVAVSQHPIAQKRFIGGINITERQRLWVANIELFKMRPLTGTGFMQNNGLGGAYVQRQYPNEVTFGGHAHNNLLHMIGGTGIAGTLPWILWCAIVFAIAWRSGGSLGLGHGWVCAWIVFHLNGLTQVNFWEGKVEHQMAWACAWALAGVALKKTGAADAS